MLKLLPLLLGLALTPSVLAEKPSRAPSPARAGAEDGEARKRVQGLGEAAFKQGNYRQAAEAFRKEIAENPDSVPAHLGLGRALTRLGRCDKALAEFWPYVGMKAFSAETALAAAVCSGRIGLSDDAVTFSQIAVERDPENTSALTNLVLALDAAGRNDEVEELLDQLVVANPARDASFFARAVLALRRGDIDEFDIIARDWPTDRETARLLVGLKGQSWLDLDDPVQVGREMRGIHRPRRPGLARMVNAESVRCAGEVQLADEILSGRALRNSETSDTDAIRVRVLADQGDFVGAQAILDRYDLLADADLVASAWYLAWHESNVPEMARLRDAYLGVRVSPLRHLYHLIPITWRLDYVPGAPMPRPPAPEALRAAAQLAAEQQPPEVKRPGPSGPGPAGAKGPRPGSRKPAR